MSIPTEEEIKNEALRLRIDKRLSYREIAHELGLSLGRVGQLLKGVPLPILKKAETAPEKKDEGEQTPVSVPSLISPMNASKLFALAMDEGFKDVNTFIDQDLIPWHQVKRDFEWKLQKKPLNAKEFETYIEICMIDSIELRDLKLQIGNMGSVPGSKTAPPTVPHAIQQKEARS